MDPGRGETDKWMHAVGGYKYKNKTGMRNGNVRQAGCNFKYWGPTWLHEEAFVGGMANEMGLPSQRLQSSDNFLMSACPEARDSAKYLCTVFHLIY